MMQHLGETKDRTAPICKVIARNNEGVTELLTEITQHRNYLMTNGLFESNRKKRLELEMKQIAHNKLLQKTSEFLHENYKLEKLIDDVYEHKTDIYSVVNNLLQNIVK